MHTGTHKRGGILVKNMILIFYVFKNVLLSFCVVVYQSVCPSVLPSVRQGLGGGECSGSRKRASSDPSSGARLAGGCEMLSTEPIEPNSGPLHEQHML